MAITIKDVARVANVSTTTGSKVINRNPTISGETTRHVLEVIKKLNYTPNLRARSFASKKTMRVAFVTHIKPNLAFINPHFFEIMVGSQRYLSIHQYQMEFVEIRKNEIETSIKHIVDSKGVDGIIVHASAITPEVAKYLVKTNFPHVVIGCAGFSNKCLLD